MEILTINHDKCTLELNVRKFFPMNQQKSKILLPMLHSCPADQIAELLTTLCEMLAENTRRPNSARMLRTNIKAISAECGVDIPDNYTPEEEKAPDYNIKINISKLARVGHVAAPAEEIGKCVVPITRRNEAGIVECYAGEGYGVIVDGIPCYAQQVKPALYILNICGCGAVSVQFHNAAEVREKLTEEAKRAMNCPTVCDRLPALLEMIAQYMDIPAPAEAPAEVHETKEEKTMTNTNTTKKPDFVGKPMTIQTREKKTRAPKNAPHLTNYDKITAKICAAMEGGVIPWKKMWSGRAAAARNYTTNRPYSLLNQLILGRGGRYATWKQWHELGARIKKGAKAEYIYFFTQQPKETDQVDENGEKIVVSFPVLREYAVFHENDTEGIELKPDELPENTRIKAADSVLNNYLNGAGVEFYELLINEAYYAPRVDAIKMPEINQFANSAAYYATAFHECGHSTGHASRLNREGVNNSTYHAFGDEVYSREELIAEMCSAFVCSACGIDSNATVKNSAAYIQSWLRALKNDSKMIVYAASRAEKAAEYILGFTPGQTPDPKPDHNNEDAPADTSAAAVPEEQTAEPTAEEKPAATAAYYTIDEKTAAHAHEMNHFSDYKSGSLTAEYKSMVDQAVKIAEQQKKRVDPIHHDKIDYLVDLYARRLAENLNAASRIDASYPSVLIAGPAGMSATKKAKQNARRDANMQEYKDIQGIINKIKSVGMGGISSGEENALEKLTAKLDKLTEWQETMKRINAYWRKHKTFDGCPDVSAEKAAKWTEEMQKWGLTEKVFPSWELSKNNAEIRRIKARIEALKKELDREPAENISGEGWELVENKEIMRLQFIFDGKPDLEVRGLLKRNGFKWSPKNNAWQRLLNNNARWAAKDIIKKLEG